jgi:hypothetical protein
MTEWQGRKREPITEERLERAVDVLSQIVKEHGPSYGPLYESVEQELVKFRRLKESIGSQKAQTAEQQGPRHAPKAKKRLSA